MNEPMTDERLEEIRTLVSLLRMDKEYLLADTIDELLAEITRLSLELRFELEV